MTQGMYEIYRDNDRYPVFWDGEACNCFPHFHSSLEFSYTAEGSENAMINGHNFSIRAGQLFMVSSFAAHSYTKTNSKARIITLIVPLEFIPLYAPLFSKKIFAKCLSDDIDLNREVLHCLKMILALGKIQEQNENLIRSYIYVILGLLIQKVGLIDTSKDKFLSKDILVYLQNNYLCPISLESISKKFGYSKYRFSHIFNQNIGCTLAQYIASLRARHAANLLRESDSSLLEIAMNSGFDSVRTFYRSFKNCFGMTPTEYRRSIES